MIGNSRTPYFRPNAIASTLPLKLITRAGKARENLAGNPCTSNGLIQSLFSRRPHPGYLHRPNTPIGATLGQRDVPDHRAVGGEDRDAVELRRHSPPAP